MTGFDIFAIALVLLVIFTLFAGIKTVPQGYDWTIERFGKYTRTLAPGLNIIVPYFDRVGRKMVFHFIADKYIKAFGQLADSPNQKIVMLPIEAVNVLGSLAGIGENRQGHLRRKRGIGRGGRAPRFGAASRTEPAAGAAAATELVR
jgi:hypothetical protein